MVKFATAPVQDVAPRARRRQLSQRAQMRAQYEQALQEAIDQQQALIIVLEEGDNALTIRNRIARAAARLGLGDIVVRRRGERIVAYRQQEEIAPRVATDDALGG